MNTIFFFPPYWCLSHPYMSIPCILPYLKNNGISILSADLNVLSSQYYKSKEFLDKCLDKIAISNKDSRLIKKYEMIHNFLLSNKDNLENILHDPNLFLDYEKYIFTSLYQDELGLFRNIAYNSFPNIDDKDVYIPITNVLEIINNVENNYYWDFYDDTLNKYMDKNIDIVILSLAGTQQIIPTFTLCKYIKEHYPKVKIILGGNPFTKIKSKIDNSWQVMFQKLFDYILLYEGEYVLVDLLKCLETEGDIFQVYNCVHYVNGNVIINDEDSRIVDIENGFTPDFGNYNLQQYSTPFVILPYYVERGCYWKKCTFCDHDFGFSDCYRIKTIDKVITDLKEYISIYNVKYVHFVDEAIPPAYIEKMCNAFIENNIQIKWFTCIKASKKFTVELCELMKKAGCVFVSIGIESCCQDVLDRMDKGIDIQDIEITLEHMRNANIWTHAFMINDFEGETYKNKWETFAYVNMHKDIFTSIGIGNFTLSKNAKIFNSIELSEENTPKSDFTNDYFYKSKSSLDEDEYLSLFNVYTNLNYTSQFFARYMYEREHLAIFMSEKEQFINSKYLSYCIEPLICYNKKYIIICIEEKKLYAYSLINKKFFVLPKEFSSVLECFDGNLAKLKADKCMDIFTNKDEVIDFLINQLYA